MRRAERRQRHLQPRSASAPSLVSLQATNPSVVCGSIRRRCWHVVSGSRPLVAHGGFDAAAAGQVVAMESSGDVEHQRRRVESKGTGLVIRIHGGSEGDQRWSVLCSRLQAARIH